MNKQLDLLGLNEYSERVKAFQRMFDKNDDEFRWTLLKMNKELGYEVVLDNDDTMVVFPCENIPEEIDHLCEWVGTFTDFIGNSQGVGHLLDSVKIPWSSV